MKAKPIFICKLPQVGEAECNNIRESLENRMTDYHVIVATWYDIESIDFEVFYEKDMTHIKWEELKDIISESVKEPAI